MQMQLCPGLVPPQALGPPSVKCPASTSGCNSSEKAGKEDEDARHMLKLSPRSHAHPALAALTADQHGTPGLEP